MFTPGVTRVYPDARWMPMPVRRALSCASATNSLSSPKSLMSFSCPRTVNLAPIMTRFWTRLCQQDMTVSSLLLLKTSSARNDCSSYLHNMFHPAHALPLAHFACRLPDFNFTDVQKASPGLTAFLTDIAGGSSDRAAPMLA